MTKQKGEPEENEKPSIKFTCPILTIRTKKFNGVFNKLGSFEASRLISWIALIIVPIVAGVGLYLICSTLFTLLWTPAAREIQRGMGLGTYLIIPWINPLLPILTGWIALISAIVIHEGAHGVIARNRGLKVNSSGLLFFLIIPIGAFVDVDEKQLAKAKARDSLRILAAGVGGNIAVAIVCVLSILAIVNGLTPVIDGLYIHNVTDGMPAEKAGLMTGDVYISINNVKIGNFDELEALLEKKNPSDVVQVVVARGEKWKDQFSTSVNLTESDGHTVMGVTVGNLMTEERLRLYRTLTLETFFLYLIPPALAPGLVPFSDYSAPFYTHVLEMQWHVLANLLFWLWFVNVNVAILNALPIYPLDGGQIFNIWLKSIIGRRLGEKTGSRITIAVTVALIVVLLLIVVIPFVL